MPADIRNLNVKPDDEVEFLRAQVRQMGAAVDVMRVQVRSLRDEIELERRGFVPRRPRLNVIVGGDDAS